MVVAIRGTSSLADLVTDAVVHPEAIDDWLPPVREQARPALLPAGAQGRASLRRVMQWRQVQLRPSWRPVQTLPERLSMLSCHQHFLP